ncbi:MAG: VOC family protein [Solirubrobacteraceae bacterium]
MTTEHDALPTSIAGLVHGQVCYLQLPAVDITASARFYERVFGWRVELPDSGFDAPALIGQWITDRPASPDGGPVGWIFVHDIAATLREAAAAGATACEGPEPDGPRRLGTFTDPAGNRVGIAAHEGGAHVPRAPVLDNRTMPTATVVPQLVYDDVGMAIDWLCGVFGFTERWRAGDHRAQLAYGNGCVVVTESRTSQVLTGLQSVMVRIADADRHHDRARERGAKILGPPTDYPYGERQYAAEDLGGHQWHFSQSIADLAPEEWGGTSGQAYRAPSNTPSD